MLLAGDIGGTKTILALFSLKAGAYKPIAEETFSSASHARFEIMAESFTARAGIPIDRAVLGVAGPVVNGRARITNLPWVMDEKKLQKSLNIPDLRLINDLEAIAHAVTILKPSDLRTINRGKPFSGGAIAVIAPGTGLGESFLTAQGQGSGSLYRAHPSEGGHADFAPRNPLECELLRYLRKRFPHVSYERVCSGQGIHEIYTFLKKTGRGSEPAWLAGELAAADDPTPVIVNAAVKRSPSSRLCLNTLHVFTSILGAETGNLALKVMATKGVFLGGGIPPAILPVLKNGPFLGAFSNKGRMSNLLSRVPVHVIMNPRAALLGAAAYGFKERVQVKELDSGSSLPRT
jgi:glucokinase